LLFGGGGGFFFFFFFFFSLFLFFFLNWRFGQHSYDDKYLLAEVLVSTSVGAQLNVLEALGLNARSFGRLHEWAKSRNVTLRFKAEERCDFVRESKREEESATKHVRDYGIGSITDKVVTTITEYFWKFQWTYELVAFAGNDDADKVVLQGRTGEFEIVVTGSKEAPRRQVVVRDALDVNVTWLLSQVEAEGEKRVVKFAIAREAAECRTPRRNAQTDAAIEYFERFERWCESVHRYVTQTVFPVQTKHGLALGTITDESVFVPVLPIFIDKKAAAADDDDEQRAGGGGEAALVKLAEHRRRGPVLSVADLTLFLDEQKRSLSEKFAELAKAFPDHKGHLITASEANMLVAVLNGERITHFLVGGLDFIEDMLRAQVVAAIGKELTAADFGKYMEYHNRKVFREEFQPKAFCYAVRRPEYYPEGTVSIEAKNDESGPASMAVPVQTLVKETELEAPMQFSIAASAKVRFGGRVYVHGLMMHQFDESSGVKLTLNARARQFSCFLVLVGRIAGPGLFDPQFGFICQNKDDITIPLDVETIPSAGEFKAATVSISPEQQAFAKMFRGMQLASTLFGVCVVQIKPQMERVLRLTSEALTKEIRLTQELLDLFIQYQIPSDLLSYGGSEAASRDERLGAIRRNVKAVQLTIEWEKLKETEQTMQEAEMKAIEAIQNQPSLVGSVFGSSIGFRGDDEPFLIVEGGRRGKIASAKKKLEAPPEVIPEPEPVNSLVSEVIAAKCDDFEQDAPCPPASSEAYADDMMLSSVAPVLLQARSSIARDYDLDMAFGDMAKCELEEEPSSYSQAYMLPIIDPEEERRNRLIEEVRQEYVRKRAEMEKRREEIKKEKAELEQYNLSQTGAERPSSSSLQLAELSKTDYTKIPTALDDALERLDTDGALRPSIINVGKTWSKRSQAGLMGAVSTRSLDVEQQKLERNTCYDLLDALTRSGGLEVADAALHIVVSTTHCFARNLMDTLVKDNLNPIEKVEHTQLIVASQVFGKPASELLKKEEVERVKRNSPTLF
jgi:hypothetical protein